MLGNIQDHGLLMNYLNSLFDYIDENQLKDKTKIYMSCIEYSQNSFKDLIVKSDFHLKLFENALNQTSLIGLTKVKIESLKDALRVLRSV